MAQLISDFDFLTIIAAQIAVAMEDGDDTISLPEERGEQTLLDAIQTLALMLNNKTEELKALTEEKN